MSRLRGWDTAGGGEAGVKGAAGQPHCLPSLASHIRSLDETGDALWMETLPTHAADLRWRGGSRAAAVTEQETAPGWGGKRWRGPSRPELQQQQIVCLSVIEY